MTSITVELLSFCSSRMFLSLNPLASILEGGNNVEDKKAETWSFR